MILTALFSAGIAIAGSLVAWERAPFTFGLGDNTFFHAIATWLMNGEIFLRDFVHFRTPGSYFFYEWINRLFGSSFRSTSFAILLEAYLFQPIATVALAAAASRVLLGRVSLPVVVACGVAFFFLIPIFQLRTALPAAALALYILTLLPPGEVTAWVRSALLASSGVCLGLSYWAGMETFIFAGFAIGLAEVIHAKWKWRPLLSRGLMSAVPCILVVVVPLAWMVDQGLDLGRYLFYTVYYAIVVQPAGLNIPFPLPTLRTLQTHYAPFVALAGIVGVFVANRKIDAASIALLSYASLRMISALGRADTLHVAFSVSELPVLLAIAFCLLLRGQTSPNWSQGRAAGLYTLAIFSAGMLIGATVVLLIPLVLAIFARVARTPPIELQRNGVPRRSALAEGLAAIATMLLLFGMQYPSSLDLLKARFTRAGEVTQYAYSGVRLTREGRRELRAFAKLARDENIDSLFAFPHIPEYYSLVSGHPTKVTYFEGQIQPWELAATISEMETSQPQRVVQAFEQTVASSGHLYPLADYLSSAYSTVATIEEGRSIEIRAPRPQVSFVSRLADRLYAANPGRSFGTATLQHVSEDKLPVPVIEALQPLRFEYTAESGRIFTARLIPGEAEAVASADVEVIVDGVATRTTVESGNEIRIRIGEREKPFDLVLYPLASGGPSYWANAQVTE